MDNNFNNISFNDHNTNNSINDVRSTITSVSEAPKKNHALTIVIVIVVVVTAMAILFLKERYKPNYGIKGLSLYIPNDWVEVNENTIKNKAGTCEIVAGTLKYDMDTLINSYELGYAKYNFKFNDKKINDHTWQYAVLDSEDSKTYIYMITHSSGDYMISYLIRDKDDKECTDYLKTMEKSITLKD